MRIVVLQDTLTILYTDKPWASSTAAEFAGLWAGTHPAEDGAPAWTGSIEYQHSIAIDATGRPDSTSISQALEVIESAYRSQPRHLALPARVHAHHSDCNDLLTVFSLPADSITACWCRRTELTRNLPNRSL
jgi:hypothetical protein